MLAVTQQLAISFGVAVSAAVLRFYQEFETSTISQFHATFLTMGVITVFSGLTFMLLKNGDGRNLITNRDRKKKA